MNATDARYAFLGTTDDVVDCEQCGKPNLRSTVVLNALDADGNVEGVVYFGSTCAARALSATGRKQTGATVLRLARYADQQTANLIRESEKMLAHYAPYEADDTALIAAYARAHAAARWLPTTSDAELLTMARDMFTRHRTRIAELTAALNPAAALTAAV